MSSKTRVFVAKELELSNFGFSWVLRFDSSHCCGRKLLRHRLCTTHVSVTLIVPRLWFLNSCSSPGVTSMIVNIGEVLQGHLLWAMLFYNWPSSHVKRKCVYWAVASGWLYCHTMTEIEAGAKYADAMDFSLGPAKQDRWTSPQMMTKSGRLSRKHSSTKRSSTDRCVCVCVCGYFSVYIDSHACL